ncbi:MAG: MFS transporter [Actinomycetota bacterium]|nr:MFS transporter [Actinomycetota bacterium]
MVALEYATARGRWVIAATVLGSGVAALDATVVGIAVPAIGRDFALGVESLQWVVNGYTLSLAGLLLAGGALGDRYGRRRMFLVGVVWFAVASLLCGIAPNAPVLIAARILQGVGGALLTPGSLAILQASFAPADRARAIGAWSGLGGVATAAGPFLGGYLISAVSWRWVFLINLPLALAVLAISARYVPESRDPAGRGRLDFAGAALAAFGLAGLTYGLSAGLTNRPGRGWASPGVALPLLAGLALLGAFVVVELRSRSPMLPFAVFRSAQFRAANLVTFVVYGALGGALFLVPVHLQQVAGYSPIGAGTALLPITALMLVFSGRSGALAARIGPRLQMSAGPVVVAAGMALLARIDRAGGYVNEVLPAVLLLGAGLAITVAPLTSTALSAAPMEHAGVASAVNNDVARAAALLAVAVLPPVAGLTGASYLHPAAFAHGFRIAVLIAAGACAVGGLIAAALIRNPSPAGGTAAEVVPAGRPPVHCALDGPPLATAREPGRG